MMKKRSLSMRLDSRSSTADSETHKLDTKDDSAEPLMLPCYICGKVYHSGKVFCCYSTICIVHYIIIFMLHNSLQLCCLSLTCEIITKMCADILV